MMQAAGAALVTGLAGGNAIGGAAGAAIASIPAGQLNNLSDAITGSNPTGNSDINQALGNIVANAIATGAGAAVGGNAGAVAGYNVDRFNRQLHPDETWKMNWRRILAAERTITIVGCIALASSGIYAFLVAGLGRLMFKLDENWALLWIGAPSFMVFLILHIRLLPKYLRKAGLID